jgi:microcystin-dependent protein
MSEDPVPVPVVAGELRWFIYKDSPPNGWANCDGQILSISDYDELFDAIGNAFGGDGTSTFALPDFRSRVGVHRGKSDGLTYAIGESGGVYQSVLGVAELPPHPHEVGIGAGVLSSDPGGRRLAPAMQNGSGQETAVNAYTTSVSTPVALHEATVSPAGGEGRHSNMQPYAALQMCIALGQGGHSARTDTAVPLEPRYCGEVVLWPCARLPDAGFDWCDGTPATSQQLGGAVPDGRTPDLRGRALVHFNITTSLLFPDPIAFWSKGGSETATLGPYGMPSHSHRFLASNAAGNQNTPTNAWPAKTPSPVKLYAPFSATPDEIVYMDEGMVEVNNTTASPHANMMPSVVINYMICADGAWPYQKPEVVTTPFGFYGEIRAFAFGTPPDGWVACDGQSYSKSVYSGLFRVIIGTGTDGTATSRPIGAGVGAPAVTLWADNLPAHSHLIAARSDSATQATPQGNMFAKASGVGGGGSTRWVRTYSPGDGWPMAPGVLEPAGGGQPHENRQPYVVVCYCIFIG